MAPIAIRHLLHLCFRTVHDCLYRHAVAADKDALSIHFDDKRVLPIRRVSDPPNRLIITLDRQVTLCATADTMGGGLTWATLTPHPTIKTHAIAAAISVTLART